MVPPALRPAGNNCGKSELKPASTDRGDEGAHDNLLEEGVHFRGKGLDSRQDGTGSHGHKRSGDVGSTGRKHVISSRTLTIRFLKVGKHRVTQFTVGDIVVGRNR